MFQNFFYSNFFTESISFLSWEFSQIVFNNDKSPNLSRIDVDCIIRAVSHEIRVVDVVLDNSTAQDEHSRLHALHCKGVDVANVLEIQIVKIFHIPFMNAVFFRIFARFYFFKNPKHFYFFFLIKRSKDIDKIDMF